MAVVHALLRIHMVVGRMAVDKGHGAAGPVGSEAAGLDEGELDAPLGLDLLLDGLGEALDRPLGRVVHAEELHADLAPDGRHLLDESARRCVPVPHRRHRRPRHVQQPEEIHLHLRPDLRLAVLLEVARQPVPGVVDHDVDPAELGQRRLEGGRDGRRLRHVEREREEVRRAGALELQRLGLPRCRNTDVAMVEHFLGIVVAEPGRGAGDKEDSRHAWRTISTGDICAEKFNAGGERVI